MTPEEIKALQDKLAQLEADSKAKDSQLAELTKAKTEAENKVQELVKAQEETETSQAENSGDLGKLLAIARKKIETLEADVTEREKKAQEEKDKKDQLEAKMVETAKIETFKKSLGADLANDGYLKLVDWNGFVRDTEVKDSIAFNKDGVAQTIESFKKSFPEAIKVSKEGSMGQSAQGANKDNPNESFADRATKLGLA